MESQVSLQEEGRGRLDTGREGGEGITKAQTGEMPYKPRIPATGRSWDAQGIRERGPAHTFILAP